MPRTCSSPSVVLAVVAAALAALALARPAAADLPPPDGVKRVSYGFTVSNLAAFPGHVLTVFPRSMRHGMPKVDHAVVKDGERVEVGPRGAPPRLFAVKKADYDVFNAGYKPTETYEDPPLEAFFKSSKVVLCDAELDVRTEIPEGDPRDRVSEAFRAVAIDDGRCHLIAAGAAAAPPSVGSPSTSATAPANAVPTSKSSRSDPAAAARDRSPDDGTRDAAARPATGCAGCAIGAEAPRDRVAPLALAAAGLLGSLRAARRRRRDRQRVHGGR